MTLATHALPLPTAADCGVEARASVAGAPELIDRRGHPLPTVA
jgi:hypothetical protein